MLRRKFEESLKVRKYRLQVKEIKIKVIIYNPSRIISLFVILIIVEEFYRAEILYIYQPSDLINKVLKKQSRGFSMISIVIPIFNEQVCIPILFNRIVEAMQKTDQTYEVIFIDDGSTDNSLAILQKLREQFKNIKILEFSRNFGQGAAHAAGLDFSQGDAVILMDGDLQHPPELIPELIKKWQEGYDIAYTIRQSTAESNLLKRFTSSFFPKLISFISSVKIPEGAADFRIMDKRVVEAFREFQESKVYTRGLIWWMGYKSIGIQYNAPDRLGGETKYSLFGLFKVADTVITSFSSFPLYISALVGMIISFLSFLYGLYSIYIWYIHGQLPTGFTSLVVSILFLGGIQLIGIGILGIYLGKIYEEVKHRPRYIIREKYF